MNKFLSSPSPTSKKKNDIRFLSYFTHRKKWSCAFFWGPKKNPSKSTSSSPIRSRVDSIELTPPADTTCGNPAATNLSWLFLGCLGGMQGSSACFVWALAPYYKKKGSYIFLYILSYMCSFIFIFGYLCILFIPMKVQPAIFVLDI